MIILGLGSNVGGRLEYLESAIHALSESVINITAISPIYESPALLKAGSPDNWNVKFLNMAIVGETHLSSQALLTNIKCIEKKVGRQDRGVWAPREIDIDILAYEDLHINEDYLKVPHIALCERAFALLPLTDIAPNWRYPAEGKYHGKTAHEIVSMTFPQEHDTVKTSLMLNLKRHPVAA
jgi:2-amino-4-hydroxy-6-hydroxymethyldihydropteridine diphosphokinase